MKKIKVTNLFFKKSISKKTLLLIAIDFIFYFYITFGILLVSFISSKFNLDPVNVSVIWTVLFAPILFFKIRKDILKKGF
jgi:hypothetical protein